MSQESNIEWTDATWNPVRGCVKVSPGCANCYAETFAERFRGVAGHPYEQGFDLRLVPEKLEEPLRWKKPKRIFVNSMSDLFQDGVPDEFIDRVFAVMALAPEHTFQVLTKRAERMSAYMNATDVRQRIAVVAAKICGDPAPEMVVRFWPLLNVWLGVSVENQLFLQRIDTLKDTPAAVHFVSFEPLLESLGALILDGIEWVIVGGESGPGARQCGIGWTRSIVRECRSAGVPVFVKQLGSLPVMVESAWRSLQPTPLLSATNHKKVPAGIVPLKLYASKGGNPDEWPEDLRVRQFPAVRQ